ncbi:MAG: histidine kinase [Acidocella sp. 20-57-95]|nr:MAG: histidine kinase [Acidocella sp. 20-57-95]OYV58182.1 MAG: histidine kinase [Acidocella sp. 21-58-7]HQT64232.1 stimulus-sensing domain-containing protein [Acidocella sp.]HQU03734.1 stimulus-sensing domain-containing protein [Acidocella sp.]
MTKRTRLSRLLRDILLVNLLPVALIFAALFYLDQYQQGLLSAEVSALREQARIFAGALSQSAVQTNQANQPVLNADLAQPLLYQLIEPTPNAQALIYGPDGQIIANSRIHPGPGGAIVTEPLPAAPPPNWFNRVVSYAYDHLSGALTQPQDESGLIGSGAGENPATLGWEPDAREALQLTSVSPNQEAAPYVRRSADGQLLVTVAEPISRSQQNVGTVLLTREASAVDQAVLAIRLSILGLFALALALTVIVSFYLARTIASPILRLASAAALMREGRARTQALPDAIIERNDEIGTLARALDGSSKALWARMDAIEQFAADVSHEIKNPLSSIRSAIETLTRVEDPTRATRLLAIVTQDVARLDRLITDISDSSRLDSELSRTRLEVIDLAPILETLTEMHDATRKENGPRMVLDSQGAGLTVRGVETRLVQVLRNLIGNAISFSPPDGFIWLRGRETGGIVELAVEDEGPGIPDGKLDSIFDRFYSERPTSEQFGSHSGLGLSISRQIIEAHQGRISAENRRDTDGNIIGARFVIRLPKAETD